MRHRPRLRPTAIILVLLTVAATGAAGAQPSPAETVLRAFLGVTLEPLSDPVRAALALEPGAGVMIRSVLEKSAAEEGGLQAGDVLLAVGGRDVRGPRDVMTLIGSRPPGDPMTLEVWRRGRVVHLGVVLQARPAVTGRPDRGRTRQPKTDGNRLGIQLAALNAQLADYFIAPGGALVTWVTEGSPGAVAGLMAGDVIVAVDNVEAGSPRHVKGLLAASEKPTVLLGIVRNGTDIYIRAALE